MYTLLNWMVKMKFKDKKVLFCLMLFFLIIISISNVSANNLNDVNIDNFTSISYDSIDAIEYDVESDGNQIFDNSLNHEDLLEIGDDDVIITSDNFGSYFNDGIIMVLKILFILRVIFLKILI